MVDSTLLMAENLSRFFGKDRFAAVRGVSLRVHAGEVFALVGPNGAGKTTTVRMCSTLLSPSQGVLEINGVDAVRHPQQARHGLGLVLGGDLGFYPRATALDNLLFFADVAGLSGAQRRSEVADALQRVGLSDRASSKVGEFSRGMKQRLHIARALLGAPRLLLLDEPTSGLDPEAALSVRDLIASLAADGVGVLLTSHTMDEVEELASVISVIGAGHIVVSGQVRDIARYAGIRATTSATLPAQAVHVKEDLEHVIGDAAEVRMRAKGSNWSLAVHWREDPAEGLQQLEGVLSRHGLERPADLFTRPASLQDAYLAISDGLQR
ncbi:MAG: ABC transporter ATP-binding protein [Bifidobacterium sp.]|jgi:ABC-2 type transport system ATP-binding protein|nr:ABC transporter ATP-binding protein [Bifidobacterium sp.]